LPDFTSKTFEYQDQFIGDIHRGGSCNVDVYTYSPHNHTHIEVSSHIVENGYTLNDLTQNELSGIVLVIDLSDESFEDNLIRWKQIERKLRDIVPSTSMLAIKTKYSTESYPKFSGNNPIAVDPELSNKLTLHFPKIKILLLDLPSIDSESSEVLLAHRRFFNLPNEGITTEVKDKKGIVELAKFTNVSDGYYFCMMSPPKTQTNAAITDIIFHSIQGI
ncbi:MAG: cyclase family protein, partial [Candidatus Heimdallarchaeota archaeon]|nr:cyclase family protein [Candidatus Heimdallarchaeota archaeon]